VRPNSGDVPDARADLYVRANDGLRLHVRRYGPQAGATCPIVCLPGLTRTAADFHVLARALVGPDSPQRRVYAVDYRGRGLSEYDSNPQNYSPAVELADLLSIMAALELGPAIFIGTSRGGLLTMLLAAARPQLVAGAILNDIGPEIAIEGLLRIKSYVGKLPAPADYGDAAVILKRLFGAQFPALTEDEWRASAERAFKREDGRLVPTYDTRIAETLSSIDAGRPLPALWQQFDALAGTPTMVVRGELSDILTRDTVAEMKRRHPALEIVEVPNQGHAPLLADAPTIARIADFVARHETRTASPQNQTMSSD
jgi:pimeloyl-ACP methyl ester carboxylesterase